MTQATLKSTNMLCDIVALPSHLPPTTSLQIWLLFLKGYACGLISKNKHQKNLLMSCFGFCFLYKLLQVAALTCRAIWGKVLKLLGSPVNM
jgi:hypothetical protein